MHETGEVFDRRSSTRVSAHIPLEIQFQDASRRVVVLAAQATDVSEHGLSIYCSKPLPAQQDLHFKMNIPGQPRPLLLMGRCALRYSALTEPFRHGVQIHQISPDDQRMLSGWLSDSMLNINLYKDRRHQRTIHSQYVFYKNSSGGRIVGFVDSDLQKSNREAPFIVLSPGFGETKSSTLSLAFMLVKNGFRVLRYDPTNHTGESDGTIVDCTLSQLKDDLEASISFLRQTYHVESVGLIVSSLSGLVGFQVASEDERVAFLGSLVPVVNLTSTLHAVYNEDLVSGYLSGRRVGLIDMLGFPIDADRFLEDAINHDFHSVEAIEKTLEKIRVPVWAISGSDDSWVSLHDIYRAFNVEHHPSRGLTVIEKGLHQLHENALASRAALVGITKAAISVLMPEETPKENVILPRLREVAIQSRLEKERRKLLSGSNKSEDVRFWSDYLQRFRSISRVPDFKDLYETIQRLSGPICRGDVILDAGCGNGSYGSWLLQTPHVDEASQETDVQYNYVGLDFVPTALAAARRQHQLLLSHPSKASHRQANFGYILTDLDRPLPFLDEYFSKICCNLVLSYVRQPQNVLRELYRVLAPGGTLVLTSLKPYADLSVIYRNFLQKADTPEDVAEAKTLLTNAGLIRSRESEGHFKFFSEAELSGMMTELGIEHSDIVRSFANQANVMLVQKKRTE